MKNFWRELKPGFICSAPMAGITDVAFRQMLIRFGGLDVIWTEMVSVEAINRNIKKEYEYDFLFEKKEQPVIAQLFGSKTKQFEKAVKLVKKLGFAGVDINMGCPDKNIIKQGGGSALINEPSNAVAIIKAVKKAAGDMPVSIKTRIGFHKPEYIKWFKILLACKVDAITVHGRTKQQMYTGRADWEAIAKIVKMRDKISPKTKIIGNGDVKDLTQAKLKIKESRVDGVMVGRAMLANPWMFCNKQPKDKQERIKLLIQHAKLYKKYFKQEKHFDNFKKYIKAYFSGFDGSKEMRVKLMQTKSVDELIAIIKPQD